MTIRLLATLLMLLTALPAQADQDEPHPIRARVQPAPGAELQEIDIEVHRVDLPFEVEPADSIELDEDDIVVGVLNEGVVVAYPVRFVSLYGIVSDDLNGLPIAVSWSPLTGSGVVFDRRVDGRQMDFDFGTGLVHDAIVFVDRETQSVWSQLDAQAVSGPLEGSALTIIPSMQVTWKYWRSVYPETGVMWLEGREGVRFSYGPPGDRTTPPGKAAGRHQTEGLGLGLVYEGNTMFFPLTELGKSKIPVIVVFGLKTVGVYYDPAAAGAFAIDEARRLLPAILMYDWAWKSIYPRSGIYREGPEF